MGGGCSDYWIIKLDSIGNIQWQNTIGGSYNDYLSLLQQTTDGGYILGGESNSNISYDKTENNIDTSLSTTDYWVVKIDSIGNLQWQNTIGGNNIDVVNSICQTFDGGYLLSGSSNSDISGDKTENCIGIWDYWILKLDSAGNIQWQNTIGGYATDKLFSACQTIDGGYFLGGWSDSNIGGDKTENSMGTNDYWVLKLDSYGNIQWQNTIGGTNGDDLTFVQQTSDLGYILGGYSWSNISGDKTENNLDTTLTYPDYWVVKLNSSGNIQWQNTIGGNRGDVLNSIKQTADGGYILGGNSSSDISVDKTENAIGGPFYDDYWGVKLNSAGTIEWDNTIGGIYNEELHSIQQTVDGGYILGGHSASPISGDKTENYITANHYDYWIVKLYPDTITSVTQLPNTQLPFSISPNPSSGIFQISFPSSSKQKTNYTIEVFNTFSQKVFQSTLSPSGRDGVGLDLSFLSKGIYLLKISDGENAMSKKIIIY